MKSTFVVLILAGLAFARPACGQGVGAGGQTPMPSARPAAGALPVASNSLSHLPEQVQYERQFTNGVGCVLRINYEQPFPQNGPPPMCVPVVVNETTNIRLHFMRLPLEGTCEMKLLDSTGAKVKKSAVGRKYVFWTRAQIDKWYSENIFQHMLVVPIAGAFPGGSHEFYPGFSIPQAFALKEPGEYSLYVRLKLLQNRVRDASGTFTYNFIDPPEVVAKVKIRAEDIQASAPPPSVETNGAPK